MRKWLKWLLAVSGAVLIVLLLYQFAFTSSTILSSGMEPSLLKGDRVIVNKWSYGFRTPCLGYLPYHRWSVGQVQQGDYVLFNNPFNVNQPVIDKREVYLNRCIGIPGDTLYVDSLFSLTVKTDPVPELLYTYPVGEENGDSVWIKPVDNDPEPSVHPLIVPGKGITVKITPWNIILLRNTIVLHENKLASVINGRLYISGKQVNDYTFTQDYYWMVSDNTTDSRMFGFVPHSHLIGKASVIWFSKKPDTGFLKGYRWNRFFTHVR